MNVLVSSVICSSLVVLALLGFSYWVAVSPPLTSPDGTPDNALVRAFGLLLYASPFIFLFLALTTFIVSITLRAIVRRAKRAK